MQVNKNFSYEEAIDTAKSFTKKQARLISNALNYEIPYELACSLPQTFGYKHLAVLNQIHRQRKDISLKEIISELQKLTELQVILLERTGLNFEDVRQLLPSNLINSIAYEIISIYKELCTSYNQRPNITYINKILQIYNLSPEHEKPIETGMLLNKLQFMSNNFFIFRLCQSFDSSNCLQYFSTEKIQPLHHEKFIIAVISMNTEKFSSYLEELFAQYKMAFKDEHRAELANYTLGQFIALANVMPIEEIKSPTFDFAKLLASFKKERAETDDHSKQKLDIQTYNSLKQLTTDEVLCSILKEKFQILNVEAKEDSKKLLTLFLYSYIKPKEFRQLFATKSIEEVGNIIHSLEDPCQEQKAILPKYFL